MKTLILSTVAALAIAGPALADDGSFYHGERSHGEPAYVIAHFDQDGDSWRPLVPVSADGRLSTSNQDLAAFAANKLDNGERGFK